MKDIRTKKTDAAREFRQTNKKKKFKKYEIIKLNTQYSNYFALFIYLVYQSIKLRVSCSQSSHGLLAALALLLPMP